MAQQSVLFICLGNICRSPMAEAIFTSKVKERGLESLISVDSAGTGNWHVGEVPDSRTISTLAKHGIAWVSRARQVKPSDFTEFDYVVAMDQANEADLVSWKGSDPDRVSLMMDWAAEVGEEVPDPYYGGLDGFDKIFEMLDRAADGLLNHIVSNRSLAV